MFYSENILAKRGPLAKVWLAAHWERKLSKTQFLQTNIPSSISAIVEDYGQPMALRLSGQLLLGVVRIFSRKTRYLLEDCSEAIVKIKMAFRPGLVDLTDEQAIASTGAITVLESFNQFDMLMPDPVFDLKALLNTAPTQANTSRLQDITLQPDFLSFTQTFPDDMDQIGLNSSRSIGMGARDQDISMEIGRDAIGVREFTPGPDALSVAGSIREKSVGPNDPLLGEDISFELGLENDALNNNNFDFTSLDEKELVKNNLTEERMLDFDDDYGNGPLEDLKLDNEENLMTSLLNEHNPSPSFKNKAAIKQKARKRTILSSKKRKVLIDEKIELSSDFLKGQLNDTRNISSKENFVPVSRIASQLQKKKSEWLKMNAPNQLFNLNEKTATQLNDFHVIDDNSFQMVNDDYGNFEFDSGHEHKRLKAEDLDAQDGFQDLEDSIVFNHSLLENKPLDFDFAPAAEEDYLRVAESNDMNSFKTLSTIESNASKSKNGLTTFLDMTKDATRVTAAKLFFELLSLKSKGAIDLSQEKPFSNIIVTLI